jgi:hypothetical protein
MRSRVWSHRTVLVVVVAAVAMLASVSLLALRSRSVAQWTDGASIRVDDAGAPLREVLWKPATPVNGTVNSSVDEYEPRLTADGTIMVFVRRRPDSESRSNADLFTARWTAAGWSEPLAIDDINSDADELGPEVSADGGRLYFYSNRAGGLGGYDLWVSQNRPDGWSSPVNLGSGVNTAANEYSPALTPDGSRLFFASNRVRPGETPLTATADRWDATVRHERARHDYDLYVAEFSRDDSSSVPRDARLLASISTTADEGSPAVSPVGDFLYFASDRPGGSGGFDLYRSRLRAGEPDAHESVGDAVNTAANELDPGLSAEGFRLYFSSDRSADGQSARQDYGLWWTASREVYRDVMQEKIDLAALWSTIWPWLLLLLLLALLGLLLGLLVARHEHWRAHMRRMSLLAQCILVSCLVHLLIAMLLAAWRIGSDVTRLLCGGHRVQIVS